MGLDQYDALHEDNLRFIADRAIRIAYIYLIRHAERLVGYRCYPNMKGAIRTFRYYAGAEQPFAFIVNRKSLLFYFRKPAVARGAGTVERLTKRFAEVRVPRSDEITVRIDSIADARQLMKEAFGVVDAELSVAADAREAARR